MPEPGMASWSCCPSPDHLDFMGPERKLGLGLCALFSFLFLLSLHFLGLGYLLPNATPT